MFCNIGASCGARAIAFVIEKAQAFQFTGQVIDASAHGGERREHIVSSFR